MDKADEADEVGAARAPMTIVAVNNGAGDLSFLPIARWGGAAQFRRQLTAEHDLALAPLPPLGVPHPRATRAGSRTFTEPPWRARRRRRQGRRRRRRRRRTVVVVVVVVVVLVVVLVLVGSKEAAER